MKLDAAIIYRFYGNVSVQLTGKQCWLWKGATSRGDYGVFNIGGKLERAHRLSYEIHNGPITKGLHCLHKCDEPNCINPDHLFLGTNQDNVNDMVRKQRHNWAKGLKIARALKSLSTTCKWGHLFIKGNFKIEKYKRKDGRIIQTRRCLLCRRTRERGYRETVQP